MKKLLLLVIGYVFAMNILHASEADIFATPELEQEWINWSKKADVIHKWFVSKQKRHQLPVSEVVIYPFGGGDVVFPFSFFPHVEELVIIGLEPAGKEFSMAMRPAIIENLKQLLRRGFFVTRDMEGFSKSGMLTTILVQLHRLGAKNLFWSFVQDNVVEIEFTLHGYHRRVVYIKMNLADDHYKQWSYIFEQYESFTLLIKSASFVLQQVGFAKILQVLLQKATLIVQDDTGVSLRNLRKNGYEVLLYGVYDEPCMIPGLVGYFQPDLKEEYQQSAEVLPFEIGYRPETQSNLLIAFKPDGTNIS